MAVSHNLQLETHKNDRGIVTEIGFPLFKDESPISLGRLMARYCGKRNTRKGDHVYVATRTCLHVVGLLKGLLYDIIQFNTAVKEFQSGFCNEEDTGESTQNSSQRHCYLRKHLIMQCEELGATHSALEARDIPFEIPGLSTVIEYIESLDATKSDESRRQMLGKKMCDFEGLADIYYAGAEIVDNGLGSGFSGHQMGLLVRATYIKERKSFFGESSLSFWVAFEYVASVGSEMCVIEFQHEIQHFSGTMPISSLGFPPLTLSDKKQLAKRGAMYQNVSVENTFMQYESGGFISTRGYGRGRQVSTITGRVMLDTAAGYARGHTVAKTTGVACDSLNTALKITNTGASDQAASTYLMLSGELPDELVWRTWPTVTGFSFEKKCWGQVLIDRVEEVQFNTKAFEMLVMERERKDLIEALVVHSDTLNGSDIIAGKGEGTIFLLHGPPGVGKTLTAEAIAELLKRPLYTISMGELGTNAGELDKKLSDVFDLCTPWNALVLIDEAEMLLERRAVNDITRNAMVCVMLRLLEYYRGILFLTSNRVQSLDPAFQSRVTCALRYKSLDKDIRAEVWRGLLIHALEHNPALRNPNENSEEAVRHFDIEALAVTPLNGRQIKNTVRLALALALASKGEKKLAMSHLMRTRSITSDFMSQLTSDNAEYPGLKN